MRTDVAGNLIWKKSYTRALNTYTNFLRVLLDEETNILVLAQTGGGSSDVSLLKYSLDGDLLQKQHFDFGVNETAYDMALSQNGKIFVSAGTLYFGDHPRALLLKVKDICPVTTPEAALSDTMPNMGDDVVVSVQNTNNAWSYSLIQINGEITLSTFQGNGGTVYFTVSNLTNDDVSEGLVVSVIEPGANCIEYSDTLHLEFRCPLDKPDASLANETPVIGQDVVVTIANSISACEYTLIQINEALVLETSFGNGGNLDFTVSGLTNDDVSQGLIVSVAQEGVNCIVYSDTLHLQFINSNGIEERFQNSLQVFPNPFQNIIVITDVENNKLSKLAIFNINGQKIIDNLPIENRQQINLSRLPKGEYLLKITYQTGEKVYRKVIKK